MTFLEKLKQDNPQIDVEEVLADDCPSEYGYEAKFKCKLMNDDDAYACKRCWEREMPNAEPSCDEVKAAYDQGMADAWELAKQILYGNDKQTVEICDLNIEPVFRELTHKREIINNHTPQKARAMIDEWGESQKIEVGDVVLYGTNQIKVLVTELIQSLLFYKKRIPFFVKEKMDIGYTIKKE